MSKNLAEEYNTFLTQTHLSHVWSFLLLQDKLIEYELCVEPLARSELHPTGVGIEDKLLQVFRDQKSVAIRAWTDRAQCPWRSQVGLTHPVPELSRLLQLNMLSSIEGA